MATAQAPRQTEGDADGWSVASRSICVVSSCESVTDRCLAISLAGVVCRVVRSIRTVASEQREFGVILIARFFD